MAHIVLKKAQAYCISRSFPPPAVLVYQYVIPYLTSASDDATRTIRYLRISDLKIREEVMRCCRKDHHAAAREKGIRGKSTPVKHMVAANSDQEHVCVPVVS